MVRRHPKGAGGDALTRTGTFSATPGSCLAARHFVRTIVEEAGAGQEMADVAELVCSELATNAVRHAHSGFTVRVDCGDQGVRIAVADEAPRPAVTPVEAGSGPFPVSAARGLGIVSALAAGWGVVDEPQGKVVWADVATPRRTA